MLTGMKWRLKGEEASTTPYPQICLGANTIPIQA